MAARREAEATRPDTLRDLEVLRGHPAAHLPHTLERDLGPLVSVSLDEGGLRQPAAMPGLDRTDDSRGSVPCVPDTRFRG